MAAIQTGGFQVQNMPNVRLQDARMFVPNHGDSIPNIAAGVDFATKLFNINEAAKMRPLRQRMAEVALTQAENQIANDAGEEVIESITPEDQSVIVYDFYRNPNADPNNPSDTMDGETKERTEYGDLYKVTRGYRVLRNGTRVPFERREIVESAQSRRDKAKYADALANYRGQMAQASVIRAATAAERAASTDWKIVSSTKDDEGNVVVNKLNPDTNEVVSIPLGMPSTLSWMDRYIQGNSGNPPPVTMNVAPGSTPQAAPNTAAPAQMFTIPNITPISTPDTHAPVQATPAPAPVTNQPSVSPSPSPTGMQKISELPENISDYPTFDPSNKERIPVEIIFQYKGKTYMKKPDGIIYSVTPKKG